MRARRLFEIGGYAASVILIGFGIVVIVLALSSRSTVHTELRQQQITGTPDMTPEAISAAASKAGLKNVDLPTCTVANKPVDNGTRARCFAQYMRIHALEATGGKVYSQLGRDDPNRETWITETALSTALNVSYMAEQLSLFSLVVGIALLLTGIGLGVLTLGGALRHERTVAE
jgi:hypothetical protein